MSNWKDFLLNFLAGAFVIALITGIVAINPKFWAILILLVLGVIVFTLMAVTLGAGIRYLLDKNRDSIDRRFYP